MFAFAPSAEASRKVLRDEGHADATTVAELLVNEKLQKQIAGNVVWIDEAGQLGTKQLRRVFDLAQEHNARVILSGDWRQHGSVERGGILRLLETHGGLRPATVKTIRRQDGKYKEAVAAIAEGNIEAGFNQLDQLQWVREIPDQETRDATIAKDFVAALAEPGSEVDKALVIAPTHREAEHLTQAIRVRLVRDGLLEKESQQVLKLTPLHLTEAQRSDAAQFHAGDVIVFHQNAPGHKKGERMTVGDAVPESLLSLAPRFSVYRPATMEVAPGEQIRFTAGGTTVDGKHRINNGATARVKGFTPEGALILTNGWQIARDFGHVSHGYVQTSHSSQGRTVKRVFIAESAESFRAASREQFYVSVSRGRQEMRLYTDNKLALRQAIQESSQKMTASEFVHGLSPLAERRRRHAIQNRKGVQKRGRQSHSVDQKKNVELNPRKERVYGKL